MESASAPHQPTWMESIDQLSAPYRRIFYKFLFKLTRSGQAENQKVVNRFLNHFIIDFDMWLFLLLFFHLNDITFGCLLLRLLLLGQRLNSRVWWSDVVIVVLSSCVRVREFEKAQQKFIALRWQNSYENMIFINLLYSKLWLCVHLDLDESRKCYTQRWNV